MSQGPKLDFENHSSFKPAHFAKNKILINSQIVDKVYDEKEIKCQNESTKNMQFDKLHKTNLGKILPNSQLNNYLFYNKKTIEDFITDNFQS